MPTKTASDSEAESVKDPTFVDPGLRGRYELVKTRIAEASAKVGQNPDDVVLVAVTKNASIDVVRQLLALGHRDFGENRAQQLVNRASQIQEFRDRLAAHGEAAPAIDVPEPRWHMIGQLQRNKVRKLVESVRLVHSVDSLRLAEEIQTQAAKRDRVVEILIEVNLGEEQKGGIAAPAVRHLVDQIDSMLNVRVRGMMAMAPLTEDDDAIRSSFERCREVYEDLKQHVRDGDRINILSMGMSRDLEIGIECGANVVRVGSSLVGPPVVEDAEEEPDTD